MIYRDKCELILDKNGDGGDSARSAGLMSLFCMEYKTAEYIDGDGLCVRHPSQFPWNFPGNFSRDQLICLISGASEKNAKNIFWSNAKRLFFCQNYCRDIPGSTKYPWPHSYIDDHGSQKLSWFDFADPLFPHHIFHLILCARIRCLYWFFIFSAPLLFLSIIFNSKKIDAEQNQIICMVKVAGWKKIYKYFNPQWKDQLKYYWVVRRNCQEMYEVIVNGL